MVAQMLGLAFLYLTTSVDITHAVDIKHNGEVVYQNTSVFGVLGRAVILECGPSVPDMYIWGFTRPGTEAMRVVVYNLGKGPKIQKLAKTLGQLSTISNSAALNIDRLPLAAHGLFTCQALYDLEDAEPVLYFYYVQLVVRVPVSKPHLLVSDASPVEGSTMWMRCSLDNGTGPIQYVWQHETRQGNVTTFARGDGNLINITDVSRNHSGWYRCVASNTVNRETSNRLWLDTIFGPDVPEINVTPYSITERGYSALERETVSLLCQAQSNPASQYVWYYNNTQVNSGPHYTITKVLRMHTGDYACLAQNTYLNTRSKKTISLTVYYPPDGSPSCSVEPALNHSSLRLLCSWPGGFPAPSLQWTGALVHAQEDDADKGQQSNPVTSAAMLLPSGGLTSNNSLFTCAGSHRALKQPAECSTRTYIPPAEPVCFAYVTHKEYLMLSCSWDGGAPKALVWWEGPGGLSKGGEENSNILVLRYGTARNGKPYTCHAKHPLLVRPKTCNLTLEAPVLFTQRRVVSVYEGSDVQLTCSLRANYLPSNEITWFNNQGVNIRDTSKYRLLRTSAWANLTVRDTDEAQDSGEYRCTTHNAVGGTDINVTLVVKRYPMPPNATLIRVVYNSQQRNEVELEWRVENEELGEWTGFVLEHRWVSERPGRRDSRNESEGQGEERISPPAWNHIFVQDPNVRIHIVGRLTPTVKYQFRIRPVNHRTIGHPSAAKTPAEPRSNLYPAVIGAAIGGMLFAAILTVLLLIFIIRNRNSNPRLHDMLFGSQFSQSRENINFPEDDVHGSNGEQIGESSSPGKTHFQSTIGPSILPRAASPFTSPPSVTPSAPPLEDDNEPVNVTITVQTTGS
ncbi:V-set and immunoglobulin domain-containing protein 10-like 2 [Salarias fasciatus]|uniref:V-set and immunoglobulin domain-containing protein 10-like 2 n=1 Tax=Salarias fasciatus TaxID=181472 RepID=UPI00117656BF|nr:V-set and immunoglobulin domain-containing protein 10-like 2 [Salarias fasciatus]